jgi:hypothetical protein
MSTNTNPPGDNAESGEQQAAKPRCFARRHMKGATFAVYMYAYNVSRNSSVFNASNDRVAKEIGYHVDTVKDAKSFLVSHGWLKCLGGNRDLAKSGGEFRPNSFTVLGHDEWAAVNPGKCQSVGVKPRHGEMTLRDENSVGLFSGNSVGVKSQNPVGVKPRHKIDSKKKREREKGVAEAWLADCSCDPWRDIGLDGPVGGESFQSAWSYIFAVSHGHRSLPRILVMFLSYWEGSFVDLPPKFLDAIDNTLREEEWIEDLAVGPVVPQDKLKAFLENGK